jgi:thiamine-phosphate pyrophosphorylase
MPAKREPMGGFSPSALGLYVVTSGTLGRSHREITEAAIEGGATAIQLRAPELEDDELLPLARDLAARCHEAQVLFLVNDRPWIAIASGADGVHLGQDDHPALARERLGPDRVVGVSVADVDEARTAAAAGADYLGVTVWRTATKADAIPRGLEMVGAIARSSGLPVVGIGGIDAGNAGDVLAAGALGVAVVSAVATAVDPIAATRELRSIVIRSLTPEEGANDE